MERACKNCRNARDLKYDSRNNPILTEYSGGRKGYCSIIQGLSFYNLKKPDYSKPEQDCKYFEERACNK